MNVGMGEKYGGARYITDCYLALAAICRAANAVGVRRSLITEVCCHRHANPHVVDELGKK